MVAAGIIMHWKNIKKEIHNYVLHPKNKIRKEDINEWW
jgi:hypothetical protein